MFQPIREAAGVVREEEWRVQRPLAEGTREKVVYLPRGDGLNGRPVVNEKEVIQALRERYGDALYVLGEGEARLSGLADTVGFFADATLLIGAHGGALYNTFFAPPGAVLLEMFTTVQEVGSPLIFWLSAAMLEQPYLRVSMKAASPDGMRVSVSNLFSAIDAATAG